MRVDDVMQRNEKQRRRVLVTAAVLAALALAFYIAAFIRHWP